MARTDLALDVVMLLDKVQKKIRIPRDDHGRLKKAGLIEGRYPNLFVAGELARAIEKTSEHIRSRGLDQEFYQELLLELIREQSRIGRIRNTGGRGPSSRWVLADEFDN